jgi:hypothetical protein
MENIIEFENESMGVITKHILIDRGNGEFTSMPKSVWDEQQAAKEASGTLS